MVFALAAVAAAVVAAVVTPAVTLHAAMAGEFDISVSCSGGTYIRSLIVDIARGADAAAHMTG